MSQFSQLIDMTSDQRGCTLSDVLLKAKVLASRLRSRSFKQWVDAEINGYDRKAELPDYRVLSGRVLGEFGGYFNSFLRTPMSVTHLEPVMRECFLVQKEFHGVSYVEDLVGGTGDIGIYLGGEAVEYLRVHGPWVEDMILNRVFKTVSSSACQQLLSSVRSRLLDFLLDLREKYPDLDQSDDAAGRVNAPEVESLVTQRVYKNCTVVEGREVRDTYIAGQAGAMGPNARAENVNFVQILRDSIGEHSLGELADDLGRLRAAMVSEAKSAEQDGAVAEVAHAEEAAKKGNAKGVLEYLKSAGRWAAEMATKIGAPVAAKAIEKSLGL